VGVGRFADRFQGPREPTVEVSRNIIRSLDEADSPFLLDGKTNASYFLVANKDDRDERDD
jgi:hypothetical protein